MKINLFHLGRCMKSLQHYMDHMDLLLAELVKVATQLRDMSLKVISEEELAPLQKHQESLLAQLESVDQKIRANYPHQVNAALQEKVHQQLQAFQQLNQEFIQNLNTSHGLIQFEMRRLTEDEEEDFSRLRLNKIPSSPDSPKAIEAEENEEK